MRLRLIAFTSMALLSATSWGQNSIPLSAKQDTEGIMSKEYWKLWNPKIQAKIDRDIEQNRKADATVSLPDLKPGTIVSVEQTSSDFVFGAHIFNFDQLGSKECNDKYKNLFGTLFNRATVGFYWKTFETRPGRKRFREEYWDTEDWWNHQQNPKYQAHWRRPSTDKVVDFLESRGVAIHGHPMIWGNMWWQRPRIYKMLTPKKRRRWTSSSTNILTLTTFSRDALQQRMEECDQRAVEHHLQELWRETEQALRDARARPHQTLWQSHRLVGCGQRECHRLCPRQDDSRTAPYEVGLRHDAGRLHLQGFQDCRGLFSARSVEEHQRLLGRTGIRTTD